jgi:transposase
MEESVTTKIRNHYNPEEKVSILKKHLVDKVPVSAICDEYRLQPTVFYRWQKEFFENGAAAFKHERRRDDVQSSKIEALEAKLQKKNEVMAELMEEHLQLKKELGEL